MESNAVEKAAEVTEGDAAAAPEAADATPAVEEPKVFSLSEYNKMNVKRSEDIAVPKVHPLQSCDRSRAQAREVSTAQPEKGYVAYRREDEAQEAVGCFVATPPDGRRRRRRRRPSRRRTSCPFKTLSAPQRPPAVAVAETTALTTLTKTSTSPTRRRSQRWRKRLRRFLYDNAH
jgi:hypothetical protein